jgi:pimeloyl-ACP methyl ester carboxylesterase
VQQATNHGVTIEYDAIGTGEPVVVIHGALIADVFRTVVQEPSLRGYRLITYHRRGYVGSSRADRMLSMSEQAEDCRAVLRAAGAPRAHVVGESFGGAVALQLAVESPELVQSLALLEPALMWGESGPAYRESLAQGVQGFREFDESHRPALLDEFMRARWPDYQTQLEAVLPGAFEQAVRDAATAFEVDIAGLLNWHFTPEDASRVRQPALSILGEGSEALWSRFGEVHRMLLEALPDSEGFVLPRATHFLAVQNPRDMAEALAGFWKRHPIDPAA